MTTIERIHNAHPQARIILALAADKIPLWQQMCTHATFQNPVWQTIAGGQTRAQTVALALAAIPPLSTPTLIAIHDGARPIVTPRLITSLLTPFIQNPHIHGAIPVIPVTDSLRRINPDGTHTCADRSKYRAVQTPQIFRSDILLDAYSHIDPLDPKYTDEASVLTASGYTHITLTTGSTYNIKVTNPGDIQIADIYLQCTNSDPRH